MKNLLLLFLFAILTFSNVSSSYAQCAMCRATVESNSKSGDKAIGRGLNVGILYLMAVPYILVSVVGFLWYKNSRKNLKRAKESREKGHISQMLPGEAV